MSILGDSSALTFLSSDYSSDLLENAVAENISIILFNTPITKISTIEVGQSLRMLYPKATIYFLTSIRPDFHRRNLQKNGFTDAFLLPSDDAIFKSTLRREVSMLTSGAIKSYRAMQLIDLAPTSVLGFDVTAALLNAFIYATMVE